MKGRAFLVSARLLLANPCEENWRTVAGRAYYALLHEGQVALERWGFPLPPRDDIHNFVRQRFTFAGNIDAEQVRDALDVLVRLRNHADYRLKVPGRFANDNEATQSVTDA